MNVLVNKYNASKILKQIPENNPYYKFIKALAEGKKVLVYGYFLEDLAFDEPPSSYTIEEPFNREDWTLVLLKTHANANYILHRCIGSSIYNIPIQNFIIIPSNSFYISTEEFESLPIVE